MNSETQRLKVQVEGQINSMVASAVGMMQFIDTEQLLKWAVHLVEGEPIIMADGNSELFVDRLAGVTLIREVQRRIEVAELES